MKVRTKKPGASNKYYIRKANGGYSSNIKGKPTDPECNVLANCVGYANGAYNEEHNFGKEKYKFNSNAENFIELAIKYGLSVYKEPMQGGIMCWQKGTLSSKDGAGHVCISTSGVIKGSTRDKDYVTTAESGYGNKAFWTGKRYRGTDNSWGTKSPYKYRGTIAPENYSPKPVITPSVPRDETKDQLKTNYRMNVRVDADIKSKSLGVVPVNNVYNWYAVHNSGTIVWYAITEDCTQWIAVYNSKGYNYCTVYKRHQPLKVGDKVIPTRLVNYNGTPLKQYDPFYYITSLNGDRAVCSAKRDNKFIVWATMNIKDLKRKEW